MRLRRWTAACMLVVLAACGGSVSVGIGVDSGGLRFVLWTGNFNGDRVVDADNQAYAFLSDNGCLYNFQTGRRNNAFCIVGGGSLVQYQGYAIRLANVRSTNGACVTALVDDVTLRFIDIDVDGSGREVVYLTPLQPVLCTV